jgi:hypothetical protein
MFIFNFVVQFLNKRHFRSKICDIAPFLIPPELNNSTGVKSTLEN